MTSFTLEGYEKLKMPFLKKFEYISKWGHKLEKDYFETMNIDKKEYGYSDFAANNVKYLDRIPSKILYTRGMHLTFLRGGFKGIFYRPIDERSRNIMSSMGGKKVAEIKIEDDSEGNPINGEVLELSYMSREDFIKATAHLDLGVKQKVEPYAKL